MDQRWFQCVNMLLPQLKYGNLVEVIWNFDYFATAKLYKTATDALGLIGLLCRKSENGVGGTTLSLAEVPSTKRLLVLRYIGA